MCRRDYLSFDQPRLQLDGKPLGYQHRRIHHASKVYVMGDIHTNTVEGFWSLIKRGIGGVYHSVSQKHLQTYLDECSYRYNRRDEGNLIFHAILGEVSRRAVEKAAPGGQYESVALASCAIVQVSDNLGQLKLQRVLDDTHLILRRSDMTLIRIQANVQWQVQPAGPRGESWLATCQPLNLTVEAETWGELMESISDTLDAVLADLMSSDDLPQFLHAQGWTLISQLPSRAQFKDVRFDVPFTPALVMGANDSQAGVRQ